VTDKFWKDMAELARQNCDSYYKSGRAGWIVPEYVVRDQACLNKVIKEGDIPNYIRLFIGTANPCYLETTWDSLRYGFTRFVDLRQEHIALQLLKDSDPGTRLDLVRKSNTTRRAWVPDTRGWLRPAVAWADFVLYLNVVSELEGSDRVRFVGFMWEHLVNQVVEVVRFGFSGAGSLLRGLAYLNQEEEPFEVMEDYAEGLWECRSGMLFISDQRPEGGAAQRESEEETVRTLKARMPAKEFMQWLMRKQHLQSMAEGLNLRLFTGP